MDGPALLAFFKTTCPTCQLAFPVYGELAHRFGDALPVVAVAQDPAGKSRPWLEERGFAGPVVDDSNGYPLSKAYDIDVVPTLLLVDGGTVVDSSEGWDRDRANRWAADLARRTGGDGAPVSDESDGLPAFKPG